MLGDAPEIPRELLPLRFVERGAKVILMLPSDANDLLQRLAPRVRQVQCVGAPVARSVPALDHPELFQLVEQRDEPAWEGAERLAQRLLAEAVGSGRAPGGCQRAEA